jgi:hypothetical protein
LAKGCWLFVKAHMQLVSQMAPYLLCSSLLLTRTLKWFWSKVVHYVENRVSFGTCTEYSLDVASCWLHRCIFTEDKLCILNHSTLSVHNIRNTFLILSFNTFCPQNSLDSSGHGLYIRCRKHSTGMLAQVG